MPDKGQSFEHRMMLRFLVFCPAVLFYILFVGTGLNLFVYLSMAALAASFPALVWQKRKRR